MVETFARMVMAEGRVKTDKDRIVELEKRVAELEEQLETVMRWTGLKQPSEAPE